MAPVVFALTYCTSRESAPPPESPATALRSDGSAGSRAAPGWVVVSPNGEAEGSRSLDNSSAHLYLPPLPVPCPTASLPSRNSQPQIRRCWRRQLHLHPD